MRFGVPWSVKGIRPEARETAKEAARRSGVSLGEWLNAVIIQQAEQEGVPAPSDDDEDSYGDDFATVNERLDALTRRIEQMARSGPEAYAPKRSRNEPDQLAELIARLDRRLDQFANVARPAPPSVMPNVQLPPSLDRAVAEITARQRALNGHAAPPPQRPQAAMAVLAPTPAPPLAPAPVPLPAQDLSGLEDQLRNITNQIETLRKPGVEQAINALREELGEIGRTLNEAMPRRALDAIEKQIQSLNQRIAESRQAGVDAGALSGIEHGLAEVRDALRELTPAESLVGFNDAVADLAHKIDFIVAQKDPATLAQLESAITTLREMTPHIASNETVQGLAAQVQALGEKIETMASAGAGGDAFNHLEQRIAALSNALTARAQDGGAVPPRLEALVASLADKIEQIQNSRDNGDAFGHLEDRIVSLVERLDASDSRLGHLEAIERGLADLLVHIEDMRTSKDAGGLRAQDSPGVDDLKHDIARTQDTLEAVRGTLGDVVDRLATIEKNIRGETRPPSTPDSTAPLSQPVGRVAVRAVDNPPAAAAPITTPLPAAAAAPPPAPPPPPAPRRLPPVAHAPTDQDLPPDQPLEPGSGPPLVPANPAARIAASEAALGGALPAATAGGKSSFIAAARRAAQAAVQQPNARPPRPEPIEATAAGRPSLRAKMMQRVKSLFIAASIIAVVVGSIQIAGNVLDLGNSETKTAKSPAANSVKTEPAIKSAAPQPTASVAANPPAPPKLEATPPPASPSSSTAPVTAPPPGLNQTTQALPSLFDPPMLGSNADITGSISRPTASGKAAQPAAASKQPDAPAADPLPAAIGGFRLRSAAIAGDAAAAYEVAARYAEGRGVPANMEEAARWYERAASKGLTPAQFRYGSLLEKGLGVKKDLAHARQLYLAAAAKGNSKAMHNLAVLYAEGIDGKPEYGAAVQWFRKAAQRGVADSQYNLGVLCARGIGTAKNFPEAYKWFALAAAQGDKDSAKKRDDIATQMDAAELAAARHAVTAFVAEPQPAEAAIVPAPPGGWDHAAGAPPARVKPRPAGPLSLGAFQVGNR
jgi:localization factor PodJL